MENKICKRLGGGKLSYRKLFLSNGGVEKILTEKHFLNWDESGKVTYGESFP